VVQGRAKCLLGDLRTTHSLLVQHNIAPALQLIDDNYNQWSRADAAAGQFLLLLLLLMWLPGPAGGLDSAGKLHRCF
jgi:hypothetical protein